MTEEEIAKAERKKSCANCGAELRYKPGSEKLRCEYCGYEAFVEKNKNSFEELELKHYLQHVGDTAHTAKIELLDCKNCGARQNVTKDLKSLACVYCGEPLILEDLYTEDWILPGAVLPFQIERKKAHALFKSWINSLWFVPNKLKKAALSLNSIKGLYIPYWTFDTFLRAEYTGQRGKYYYETQTFRTSEGIKRRQVQKTRWYPASGRVKGFIDDIVVNASEKRRLEVPEGLDRWNLKQLQPFSTDYLSGYTTEKYSITLKQGHQQAYQKARDIAYQWIKNDIGGDTQRIHRANIALSKETFKHVLLPLYLSSYRYQGKTYRFFINGQSGMVRGKYPISFWKVFFLILLIVIVIGVIAFFAK